VTTSLRERKVIILLRLQYPDTATDDYFIQVYTGISRTSRPGVTIMDYFDAILQANVSAFVSPQMQMHCDAVEKCFQLSGLAGREYLELGSITTLPEISEIWSCNTSNPVRT
jgi:hypothetical protein